MREVNETDLQHLSLFGAFARAIENDRNAEPFQNLLFLIRDWSYPRQFAFGSEGGTAYLDTVLAVDDELQDEHFLLRNDLRQVFQTITGFNMPRPGQAVEEDGGDHIDLHDLNDNFIIHMKQFLRETFLPENLVLKTIGRHQIRSNHLFKRIQAWSQCFGGDQLPVMRDIYQHTLRADDDMAMDTAQRGFTRDFDEYIRRNQNWDSEMGELRRFFEDEMEEAHRAYLEAPGLGNTRERRSSNFDTLDRHLLQEFVIILQIAMQRRPANRQQNGERNVMEHVMSIAQVVVPNLLFMMVFRRSFL